MRQSVKPVSVTASCVAGMVYGSPSIEAGPRLVETGTNCNGRDGRPGLERRLKAEMTGECMFDRFTPRPLRHRCLASTRSCRSAWSCRAHDEANRAHRDCARRRGRVTPRGGGTSQAGQTVNQSLIVDCSKYLDQRARARCRAAAAAWSSRASCSMSSTAAQAARPVVSGRYLDRIARHHRRHGRQQFLRRPLAPLRQHARKRARHRCACWPTAAHAHFGTVRPTFPTSGSSPLRPLARDPAGRSARAKPARSRRAFPRSSAGSAATISSVRAGQQRINLAHILVGSEGTLGFSNAIELKLSPMLGKRAVGVCHFGSFHAAMEAAQHIVKLGPIAVELIDRTMLGLARDIAMFQPTIDTVVRGDPEAILLVEFARGRPGENFRRLMRLGELMGDLGLAWGRPGRMGRRDRGARSGAADRDRRSARGRPQHDDVDEGARANRCRSSRTARCRSSTSPTTPRA